MDRKEFISLAGIGVISALAASQFASCSKEENPSLDFILDLTAGENSSLMNPGGYVIRNNVIIAKTLTGSFIAVSSVCTHQASTVEFVPAENRFHCPSHDSRFSTTGAVINGPAESPLALYNTALTSNNLRVFQ